MKHKLKQKDAWIAVKYRNATAWKESEADELIRANPNIQVQIPQIEFKDLQEFESRVTSFLSYICTDLTPYFLFFIYSILH